MNFKKLLLATTVALSMSTGASALGITNAAGPIVPATEANFALGAFNSVVTMQVVQDTPTDTYPVAGGAILVEVNLPAGTAFSTTVSAADFSTTGGTGGTFTISTPAIAGATSVTVLYSPGPGNTQVNMALPLAVTGCAGLNTTSFNVNFTQAGAPVDGGTASAPASAAPYGACQQAYTLVLAPAAADPELTLVSDYKHFGPLAAGVALTDDTRTVGTAYVAVNATALIAPATPASTADITGFNAVLTAPAAAPYATIGGAAVAAGIASVIAGTVNPGLTATGTGANIDVVLTEMTSVKTAQAPIEATNVSIVSTLLGAISAADATLSPMVRESSNGGQIAPFDWNSEKNINSIYLVTGLDPMTDTAYTVTLTNSKLDGTDSGMLTSDAWGRALMRSKEAFGIPSFVGYQRGDVSFTFETANAIDVDRRDLYNGNAFETAGANTIVGLAPVAND